MKGPSTGVHTLSPGSLWSSLAAGAVTSNASSVTSPPRHALITDTALCAMASSYAIGARAYPLVSPSPSRARLGG